MKLLMFGCTWFIGREVVDRALKAGYTVAVLHCGEHEPEDMGEMLHIHGDNFDIVDHLDGIQKMAQNSAHDTKLAISSTASR